MPLGRVFRTFVGRYALDRGAAGINVEGCAGPVLWVLRIEAKQSTDGTEN